MSERHELGRIIWETSREDEGSVSATGANIIADAILAAGWRRPRVVNTVEELNAMPVGAVVRSAMEVIWEKDAYTEIPGHPWWISPGQPGHYPAQRITLPATVLIEGNGDE